MGLTPIAESRGRPFRIVFLLVSFAVPLVLAWAAPQPALPDGPGKELVGKICVSCHDSGNFRKARFTSEEWTDSVDDMVQRGASGTPHRYRQCATRCDRMAWKPG